MEPIDSPDADADGEALDRLFDDYAAGYDDYDAEEVAACFAYPCTIWQLRRGNVFSDEEDLLENIEALFAVLEGEEIVETRYEVLGRAVSGDTAYATLAWNQYRQDGEAALSFVCHYLLVRQGDDWAIATIVNA